MSLCEENHLLSKEELYESAMLIVNIFKNIYSIKVFQTKNKIIIIFQIKVIIYIKFNPIIKKFLNFFDLSVFLSLKHRI